MPQKVQLHVNFAVLYGYEGVCRSEDCLQMLVLSFPNACMVSMYLYQVTSPAPLPPLKITFSFHFYLKMFKFRNIKFLTHKSKTVASFHFTKYFNG